MNAAWYLLVLATVKSEAGAFKEANSLAERSLALWHAQSPANRYTLRTLALLGKIAGETGDLEQADRRFQQALDLQNEIKPKLPFEGPLYFNLGCVAQRRGDFAAAEKYYVRCLTSEKNSGNNDLTANLLNNLGAIARDRGNFAKAEYCFKRCIAIREKLGVSGERKLATEITNLAELTEQQNDDQTAAALYRRALAIEDRISPNTSDMAGTLLSYGTVLPE